VLGGDLPAAGTQEASPATPQADPAPPAADAPVVPEKYELALEGLTIDTALAEAADPILRGLGLTNEQANTLMPLAQRIQQHTQDAWCSSSPMRGRRKARRGVMHSWLIPRSVARTASNPNTWPPKVLMRWASQPAIPSGRPSPNPALATIPT
jgi:hypothetical protein